jgi:hypothetical protein
MRNNKFFSVVKDGLNWFRNIAKGMSPDLLVFEGIALFISVFINASLPSYMPQAASNETTLTPEKQLQLNRQAELNKNIFNGYVALNIVLVGAYISAINIKLKQSDSDSKIASIPTKDLEYLSLIQSALEKMPDRLDGISNEIDTLRRTYGECGFLELLNECVNDYKLRQDALSALSKGLEKVADKESVQSKESLRSAIRTSITAIIGKDCDKDSTDLFYRCMYAYITAWLVCSIDNKQNIKNRNFLPIDSIFYQDPDRKKLYIEAIKNFSDRLKYYPSAKFFPTKEILSIVQEYLKDLVELIDSQSAKPKI